MSHQRLTSLFGALALLSSIPLTVGATDPTSNFAERLLARHNRERVSMGIAPLRWDGRLAASAQGWADHLAATGRFEHAPERQNDPQGENLWAGTRGAFTLERMVDAWIREKRYFTPGLFPNNSATGDVDDIGHYTQLMWRDTGEVGCALARGKVEDVLVCRYSDAGNYIGERPF
ncbi:SCP-like extracellular [Sphingomonas sp. CL5.1]|uniref:CAP domain-containing protein n=1 Tax=Sphingomonas sp. CL5.1 TaxID=2653203 RepID=UPI0015842102|nr:CAP domain-containing protein [Sphingomonas sp. CL5.1]QKR99135.1 SCP-like extracellular [Sphingomonas sp. CL5.1]